MGANSKPYEMGEVAQVGGLMYTVLDVEWTNSIEASPPRVPANRFALVRLSIKNESNSPVSVPLLNLENDQGDEMMEVPEGQGVDSWLGLLRELEPGETIQGRILFDVQPASYRLRITDGGQPESERIAFINIPLRVPDKRPLPGLQPAVPGGDLVK